MSEHENNGSWKGAGDSPKRSGPSMADKRRKARRLVLQALYQWQVANSSISQVEAEFIVDNDFEKVDKEYFRELLRGVAAEVRQIDGVLTPLLDRKVQDVDPIELAISRMGAFELMNRVDVPYRVVINEAIELAKKFGGTDGHKFVNGILDRLAPQFRQVEIDAAKNSR